MKEILEERITDIHMHIIPDVDDGAPTMSESLSLIEEAISQGITEIFATSHSFAYIDEADARRSLSQFQALKKEVLNQKLPVNLYLGCEILCLARWMDRILDGLSKGQYPSMNHSRYVLIEFSSWNLDKEEVILCTSRLLDAGWIPVFAHIERYYDSFAKLSFLLDLRKKGCLFQMNLYDLTEQEDRKMLDLSKELIERKLIDFLGSDAHNMHHRRPKMAKGLRYLKEVCSKEYYAQLTYVNVDRYFL